jgi:hypothetical protein
MRLVHLAQGTNVSRESEDTERPLQAVARKKREEVTELRKPTASPPTKLSRAALAFPGLSRRYRPRAAARHRVRVVVRAERSARASAAYRRGFADRRRRAHRSQPRGLSAGPIARAPRRPRPPVRAGPLAARREAGRADARGSRSGRAPPDGTRSPRRSLGGKAYARYFEHSRRTRARRRERDDGEERAQQRSAARNPALRGGPGRVAGRGPGRHLEAATGGDPRRQADVGVGVLHQLRRPDSLLHVRPKALVASAKDRKHEKEGTRVFMGPFPLAYFKVPYYRTLGFQLPLGLACLAALLSARSPGRIVSIRPTMSLRAGEVARTGRRCTVSASRPGWGSTSWGLSTPPSARSSLRSGRRLPAGRTAYPGEPLAVDGGRGHQRARRLGVPGPIVRVLLPWGLATRPSKLLLAACLIYLIVVHRVNRPAEEAQDRAS